MANFREVINSKPWIGWAVAGVLLVVGGWAFLSRMSGGGDLYNPASMTEMVTIKFTDTGDTVEMPRGRMIQQLMLQPGRLDPSKGIINPKTNQPTGFLFSEKDWQRTIEQINADKDEVARQRPSSSGGK
jgi:hypothetical protein